MSEQLRAAAQAALEYMDRVGRLDMYPEEWAAANALRAALAEPQPVHECADNDSPWLICKPCAAEGKCKQAEPQPEPPSKFRADTGEPDEYFGGHVLPLYATPQTKAQQPQPDDTALLFRALNALVYYREQTRPIEVTDRVIDALQARLSRGIGGKT